MKNKKKKNNLNTNPLLSLSIIRNLLKIYNSELSDLEKIYEISKLYISKSSILRHYNTVLKCFKKELITDSMKENFNDFIDFFDIYSIETLSSFRHISENLDFYECYNYSKFIVENFINNIGSGIYSYCNNNNIREDIFVFCVKNIEMLDVDLYRKYLETLNNRKDIIKDEVDEKINSILNGIKTGITNENKKFDKLEFLRLLPFKYEDNNFEYFSNYMIENDYEMASQNLIHSYIINNKIKEETINNRVFIDEIYDVTTIINGKELTKEDYNNIYNYMIDNNYPDSLRVYHMLSVKYAFDELENNEYSKKRVLIIPKK